MANYLKEFEETLREMLTHNDPEDVVKWVKGQVLASYKNGLARRGQNAAGASRKPVRSSVTTLTNRQ